MEIKKNTIDQNMKKLHYTGYEFFLATDLCFSFPLFCHFFFYVLIFIFEHSRGHKWICQWKNYVHTAISFSYISVSACDVTSFETETILWNHNLCQQHAILAISS